MELHKLVAHMTNSHYKLSSNVIPLVLYHRSKRVIGRIKFLLHNNL